MAKKRVLVVCPGRGSYTKETLNYFSRASVDAKKQIQEFDHLRDQIKAPTLTEMDSAPSFKTSLHTKGEHASPLIYACSMIDFLNLDSSHYEVVAVTGNSMGWYIALALGGALNFNDGFQVIQTMGGMMQNQLIGGQVIYPIVNENWGEDLQKKENVLNLVSQINKDSESQAFVSIYLGGYLVLAGNRKAISTLLKELPPEGDFPFQLINHGAFHTPLLKSVSEKGFQILEDVSFQKPKIPLIDGRGGVWQPYSTDVKSLLDYTLGHQVVEPYNFNHCIEVGLKEFAPDQIMLLGPGNSLGGSLGQILVKNQWRGIRSKLDFSERQKSTDPILVSIGQH